MTSRWLMDEIRERTTSRALGIVLEFIGHQFDGLSALQADIKANYADEDATAREKRDL